jgi:hypothetical protein
MIRLSQKHLQILETCPRQFEYIYFDRLTLPVAPAQQIKSRLGKDFHLLMQQQELGLPIESILAQSSQMAGWMKAIMETAPELFETDAQTWRESEHLRTLAIDNYLFTGIYDLLILQPDRADIIDWKTYPLPRYKKDLAREWQTKLYLYLLAETSEYLPKQIAFTYWFIQSNPRPKSVQICYTLKQHRQTHDELLALSSKLTNWLNSYQADGEPFPQVEQSTGLCQHCHFATRCRREQSSEASPSTFMSHELAQIPPIPVI